MQFWPQKIYIFKAFNVKRFCESELNKKTQYTILWIYFFFLLPLVTGCFEITDMVEVMWVEGEQLTSLFGTSPLPSSSCFPPASSCSIYLKKVTND